MTLNARLNLIVARLFRPRLPKRPVLVVLQGQSIGLTAQLEKKNSLSSGGVRPPTLC